MVRFTSPIGLLGTTNTPGRGRRREEVGRRGEVGGGRKEDQGKN